MTVLKISEMFLWQRLRCWPCDVKEANGWKVTEGGVHGKEPQAVGREGAQGAEEPPRPGDVEPRLKKSVSWGAAEVLPTLAGCSDQRIPRGPSGFRTPGFGLSFHRGSLCP